MKIEEISIYSYTIPLSGPVSVAGRDITARSGFILLLRDNAGNTGFGESSPLPGLDRETSESCLRDLREFRDRFTGMTLSGGTMDLHLPFFGLAERHGRPGSLALFGMESALLILCIKNGLWKIPGRGPGRPGQLSVCVNGLFVPGLGSTEEQIRRLQEDGFRTIKVKIGRHDPRSEIRDIRMLARSISGAVLRLDGNRLMNIRDVLEFHEALKDLDVEYIEEPLKSGNPEEIPWPCAVDESIGDYLAPENPDFSRLPGWCRALVLKPGSLQGLHGIMKGAAWGEVTGRTVTLSSSYNSGAGIAALALAGLLSQSPGRGCHGFDTYRYLERDVLRERLIMDRGTLRIPASLIWGNDPLDYSVVKELT